MAFHKIDLETWPRREYYEHYIQQVVCTSSITVRLDITRLGGHKIYPAMLWLLTQTVNEFAQFRTQLTPEGLGYFDEMHPRYTVFSPEKETFSSIWTLCGADFPAFLARYREDVARRAMRLRAAFRSSPASRKTASMFPRCHGCALKAST